MGRSYLALAGWLVLSLSAGAIGGIVSGPDAWYAALDKPAWTPPSALFGPVWTTLYVLMGIAAWLVWQRRAERATKLALSLFVAQLALNAAWSWIFFGAHQLGLALLELIALWLVIGATIFAFRAVRPLAAMLLLPYWAWVTFAGALNAAIWWRNS